MVFVSINDIFQIIKILKYFLAFTALLVDSKFSLLWNLLCIGNLLVEYLLWNIDIGNRHFLLWNVKVNTNYFMKKWLVYKTYFLKKNHSFTEFPLSFGRSFFSVYFKQLTTVGRRMYNHPKNLMIQSWFEF